MRRPSDRRWSHGYTHPTASSRSCLRPVGHDRRRRRVNLAERLVRPPAGLWRDTVMLGLPPPRRAPARRQVLVQDTATRRQWRDGLFCCVGATRTGRRTRSGTSTPRAPGAIDPTPEDGVDLEYYEDPSGFSKGIADGRRRPGLVGGLVALGDDELWATFVNVDNTFAALHEVVRWTDTEEVFLEVFSARRSAVKARGPRDPPVGSDGDWVMFRDLIRPRRPCGPRRPGVYEAYRRWSPTEPGPASDHRRRGPRLALALRRPRTRLGWVDDGFPGRRAPGIGRSSPTPARAPQCTPGPSPGTRGGAGGSTCSPSPSGAPR